MMQFRWSGLGSMHMQKLSPQEAMEFAARIAELTQSGLPLGDGLRALAGELPGLRLPRVLHQMANRLDAGDDLFGVLESQSGILPGHLRGLMLAGIKNGRLTEVLEEYIDLQHSQSELRRRVWVALAYPIILLLFILGLVAFAGIFIVPSFIKIFKEFGTCLPALTVVVIEGSRSVMWFFWGFVVLSIAISLLLWMSPAAAGWIWPTLYRIPMVGPLLRWSHLTQFTRLMGLLLEQNVSLTDALQVTAAGLRNASLARGCRRAADETRQGRPLDESLASQRHFPASLIPMIQWGQRTTALPDAFRGAAEMFEGRVRSQGALLETLLLPITFLVIVTFVGLFIVAIFLPLISLIQNLS